MADDDLFYGESWSRRILRVWAMPWLKPMANMFLLKPFTTEALTEAVEQLLR